MKIFTSGAVWAILLANACGNYGAYMIMTQIPTYMKDVLKFDIKSVSVLTLFLIVLACGDSESFVRGVPTEFRHFCLFFMCFLVMRERQSNYHKKRAIIGKPAKRH